MINEKKSRFCYRGSIFPCKEKKTGYLEMSLFNTFYEDYIDFKSYIRDILDARYTNVAAENELVSDRKESYSWTIKLALEEKITALSKENEREIESRQNVIQLIANVTSNRIENNVWKTMSNKSQRIRKTDLLNETDHLVIPLNNIYEPLDVDFHTESSNKHNDESTFKQTETEKHQLKLKYVTNRKRSEHCITERYIKNQCETPRRKIIPRNRSYASTTEYGKTYL